MNHTFFQIMGVKKRTEINLEKVNIWSHNNKPISSVDKCEIRIDILYLNFFIQKVQFQNHISVSSKTGLTRLMEVWKWWFSATEFFCEIT